MHHDVENGKPCMSIDGDIAVVSALRFGIPCVVLVPPFSPPFVADSTVGTLNLLHVRIIGIGIPLQSITRGRWASRPVHFPLEASTAGSFEARRTSSLTRFQFTPTLREEGERRSEVVLAFVIIVATSVVIFAR
jgi:hypothetical protein